MNDPFRDDNDPENRPIDWTNVALWTIAILGGLTTWAALVLVFL